MTDDKFRLIRARNDQRATFKRQGASRKLRLADSPWRRPRGIQSKQRKLYVAKGRHPQSGFGSPKAVRYMHPSGFLEVLVSTPAELEGLNAETQAIRIARTVGGKKRMAIQAKAEAMSLKVLNLKEVEAPAKKDEKKEEVKSNE